MTTFPHVRLTAEGTLGSGSGNEIWACSLKIGISAALGAGPLLDATQPDVNEIAAGALGPWGHFVGSVPTVGAFPLFSDWVALTAVKASAVLASGRNDPALDAHTVVPSSSTRGGGTIHEPYQVAVAVTFRGALFARGSAALGRIFLPGPYLATTSLGSPTTFTDGLMQADAVTNFAKGAARLLTELNSMAALSSGHVLQCANIGQSTDHAGTRWQPITNVVCDSRPDTIRRRGSAIAGRGKIVQALPFTGV